MDTVNCSKCKKYRKFKDFEIPYLFYKTLVISIPCITCGSKHKIIFKIEEQIETLKILGLLKICNHFKIWTKKT